MSPVGKCRHGYMSHGHMSPNPIILTCFQPASSCQETSQRGRQGSLPSCAREPSGKVTGCDVCGSGKKVNKQLDRQQQIANLIRSHQKYIFLGLFLCWRLPRERAAEPDRAAHPLHERAQQAGHRAEEDEPQVERRDRLPGWQEIFLSRVLILF